jgi:hypothetical protein
MSDKEYLPRPGLDLGSVLKDLGHTPESFARLIGRNASGLRRAIRGESTMHHSTAREVAVNLAREGWRGDPNRIKQLRDAVPGRIEQPRDPGPPSTAKKVQRGMPPGRSRREVPPSYRVRRALRELMQAVGREEVDRVYTSVFGTKPNEKDE